jgi:hypothetical protein
VEGADARTLGLWTHNERSNTVAVESSSSLDMSITPEPDYTAADAVFQEHNFSESGHLTAGRKQA